MLPQNKQLFKFLLITHFNITKSMSVYNADPKQNNYFDFNYSLTLPDNLVCK